jgi:hypothetical protein
MRLIIIACLASVAASAEYGRFKGSGNCASACVERQEFCGTDNHCHRYGCTNWYRFGPPEYTGHAGDVSDNLRRRSNLNCHEIDATTDKNGIIYGCGGHIDSPPPDGEGFAQGLTHECIAQPSGSEFSSSLLTFVCYEMADDTDFEPFRSRVMNCKASDTECYGMGTGMGNGMNSGMMGYGGLVCRNESQTPRFVSQISLECPGFAATTGPESEVFNETLARMTMYSYLEGKTSHALVQKSPTLGLFFLAVATILLARV